ncbi:30S ribosomal protein S15 [Mycoplasmopsis agassizii]|uniref:Small ribosomal subunit protein uS15 n=1 Tax=Mycoplasmopsis agassizii TaxID=33922 RepID=A0A1W1X548_9BACT|nr:30S ribosomal protein S15 [Mycoplasmopsis agassizii]PAF55473.1 30S ribosomal protein S15 [Mycoplasmopsis agassizii]PAK20987.1 30S ribosomal protein S15 [Mycoplasmopsis agassizii]SMC18933.1 SSU ribosomal protein S15P [Mycoplasmopsis agassizii]
MKDKAKTSQLVKEFGGSEKNTGAIEVQIAILTDDIERLKLHFQENKKDRHSKRGFLAKIEQRKKLLSYLQKTNYQSYLSLIAKLGIRK